MRTLFLIVILMVSMPTLAAVGPEEVMDDPELQHRAMELYAELRCVKCRSENIASSNADWANDARAVVRERLLAGDSDPEILAFFQARYGDYVLMDPPFALNNAFLWLSGPVLLLIGGGIAVVFTRGRAVSVSTNKGLNEAEKKRLDELMRD